MNPNSLPLTQCHIVIVVFSLGVWLSSACRVMDVNLKAVLFLSQVNKKFLACAACMLLILLGIANCLYLVCLVAVVKM